MTTVLIRPNLYVKTDPADFINRVKADIEKLESQEVGKRLITKIGLGKYPVFIFKGSTNGAEYNFEAYDRAKGCSSCVFYTTNDSQYVSLKGRVTVKPGFVGLGHELIHAYHNSYGKNAEYKIMDLNRELWSNPEEFHTIHGFPSKNPRRNKPKITENAILVEHGFPERFSHYGEKTEYVQQALTESTEAEYNHLKNLFLIFARVGLIEKAKSIKQEMADLAPKRIDETLKDLAYSLIQVEVPLCSEALFIANLIDSSELKKTVLEDINVVIKAKYEHFKKLFLILVKRGEIEKAKWIKQEMADLAPERIDETLKELAYSLVQVEVSLCSEALSIVNLIDSPELKKTVLVDINVLVKTLQLKEVNVRSLKIIFLDFIKGGKIEEAEKIKQKMADLA